MVMGMSKRETGGIYASWGCCIQLWAFKKMPFIVTVDALIIAISSPWFYLLHSIEISEKAGMNTA
jgi:uncharacterized membrane protein